jgi:hypothetical protein
MQVNKNNGINMVGFAKAAPKSNNTPILNKIAIGNNKKPRIR